MKNNLKVTFVWDFSINPVALHSWDDGLKKALEILADEQGWAINVICDDKAENIHSRIRANIPDVIIGWGSLDRPSFAGLKEHRKFDINGKLVPIPTALCFAGGPTNHPHTDNFDIIFVENGNYLEKFKEQGVNAKRAFGTNDILFKPMPLKKKYLACYPTAFSGWKRHDLFAEAVKEKGIAAGKHIPGEMYCYQNCVDNNVTVLPELPYEALPYLYNQSEFALITSINGGQRNVLEAMACNVIPIVMSDNLTTCEYVKESGFGVIVEPKVEKIKEALSKKYDFPKDMGRKYIEKKYSAHTYAKAIKEGIESIL